MSRWHIVTWNERNQSAEIGHACVGAHSPYVMTVPTAVFDGYSDLDAKPTLPCRLCDRGSDHEPYLPGPSARKRDLEDGALERWLDGILATWRRTA